jgi:2-succinyl-6-hydroxy-2,4-cyclohexadiene-1-carboxylate synthase
VFLHGFTLTGASWQPVVEGLGERYRSLRPDIRGHGAAAAARPIDFDSCVQDVVALAGERFALAGYSLGGRLALHVALAHPERVSQLILVGPTAGIADEVERRSRRAADAQLAVEIEQSTIEAFARRWERRPIFKGQPAAVLEAAREDRLRNTPAGLAEALRGLGTGTMEPLWGRLPELDMPVTVIVGERDSKFRKLGERIAGLVADGRLVVVSATGHAVHMEAPDLVAATITEAVGATDGVGAC